MVHGKESRLKLTKIYIKRGNLRIGITAEVETSAHFFQFFFLRAAVIVTAQTVPIDHGYRTILYW